MKHIFLKHMMIVGLLLSFFSASAHNFEVDGIYYNKLSNNTVAVTYRGTSYSNYSNEYSGEVDIPTTVTYNNATYFVTLIASEAFRYCTTLTSVAIPNSVTSIGGSAFYGCTSLTSVEIPNSVTSIGESAFSGCTSLASVDIPNSVTTIGDYAFMNCNLKSLTIGTGIQSVGKWTSNSSYTKPIKVIWLGNVPPAGYANYVGTMNYASNDSYKFSSGSTCIYDYLSSMFEVDGIVYVPVNPSERTCDIIDCKYDPSSKEITLNDKVYYRGIEMNVVNTRVYSFYEVV